MDIVIPKPRVRQIVDLGPIEPRKIAKSEPYAFLES